MAKAKTLKPTSVHNSVSNSRGRVARWDVADGVVEADRLGVFIEVESGYLADVEELELAIKAAHLYYLNVKET